MTTHAFVCGPLAFGRRRILDLRSCKHFVDFAHGGPLETPKHLFFRLTFP